MQANLLPCQYFPQEHVHHQDLQNLDAYSIALTQILGAQIQHQVVLIQSSLEYPLDALSYCEYFQAHLCVETLFGKSLQYLQDQIHLVCHTSKVVHHTEAVHL